MPPSRLQVHVVHPDADPRHRPQPGTGGEHLLVQRFQAGQQAVRPLQVRDGLLLRQLSPKGVLRHLDAALLQQGDGLAAVRREGGRAHCYLHQCRPPIYSSRKESSTSWSSTAWALSTRP